MSKTCILKNKYRFDSYIGKGSFGEVYTCISSDNRTECACKVEKRSKKSRLKHEYKIYRDLHRNGFGSAIPNIIDFYKSDDHYVMVMELLSCDLNSKFLECGNKFKLGTTLKLGVEIISLLETIHSAGYLHRDIKPDNFMFGVGDKKNKLYIVDFGLSDSYIENGKHILFEGGRKFVGTSRYTSINVHLGKEPTRRDDLISVGYMLIFFIKGSLPWQGLKKEENVDSVQNICDVKSSTSIDKLCAGAGSCFKKYLRYCTTLEFDETPDYEYLKSLFVDTAHDYDINLEYEWNEKKVELPKIRFKKFLKTLQI